MTLGELLESVELENVDFVHEEVDVNCASIVELSSKSLTEEGKQHFENVLNAKVTAIKGDKVFLTDVSYQKLERFTYDLAGYCSVSNYEKWFTFEIEEENV